jgi:hypothetical protein
MTSLFSVSLCAAMGYYFGAARNGGSGLFL